MSMKFKLTYFAKLQIRLFFERGTSEVANVYLANSPVRPNNESVVLAYFAAGSLERSALV